MEPLGVLRPPRLILPGLVDGGGRYDAILHTHGIGYFGIDGFSRGTCP